jgi:(3S)-malyl-CoA thioesterase
MTQLRPVRSLLYIPASRARAMEKAASLPCDGIIFDLEDAVAPDDKPAARQALQAELTERTFGPRLRLVRVNAWDTVWGPADVAAFASHPGADALLLPKVSRVADLDAVAALAPGKPLWAMMETPLAMLNAAEIAAHPALQGMVMGTNDLTKDLQSRHRPDRMALTTGLGLCLLAARAHGRLIVDGVYNAFKDQPGLAGECEQGRDMGFDGKSLIHPDQLDTTNRIFAPSDVELDLARRQIDAFAMAQKAGQGVAVLDGKIVENLHIVSAQALLAKARAIAAMAKETTC